MTLNRNEFPPRGWTFWQRETKWNAPNPLVDDFETTVNRIRNHRLANLKFRLTTDREKIAAELEAHTLARLGKPRVQALGSPASASGIVTREKPKRKCGGCGSRR